MISKFDTPDAAQEICKRFEREWRGWHLAYWILLHWDSLNYTIYGVAREPGRTDFEFRYNCKIDHSWSASLKDTHVQAGFFVAVLKTLEDKLMHAIDLWEDNPRVQIVYHLGGPAAVNNILVPRA